MFSWRQIHRNDADGVTWGEFDNQRRRDFGLLGAVVTVLAIALVLVSFFGLSTSASNDSLRTATLAACYRVNFLRWEVDVSRVSRWREDQTDIAQIRYGLGHQSQTLKTLHVNGHDKAAKLLLRASAVQGKARLSAITRARRAETYLPFTNCMSALNSPTTYRPPRPQPITAHNFHAVARAVAHPPKPPPGLLAQ